MVIGFADALFSQLDCLSYCMGKGREYLGGQIRCWLIRCDVNEINVSQPMMMKVPRYGNRWRLLTVNGDVFLYDSAYSMI